MKDYWRKNPPPWKAFPAMEPLELMTANQGAQEAWLIQQWWPFWSPLSPADRVSYLHEWGASAEWVDELNSITSFIEDPDLDLEADAAESEIYLARLHEERAAAAKNQSWWSRLFNRR